MFLRLIAGFLVMTMLSGCTILLNKPSEIPDRCSVPISDDGPKNNKIWIEAKVKKVWVNQKIDENGDLVEGHFKHIVTESGHWEVNSNERK